MGPRSALPEPGGSRRAGRYQYQWSTGDRSSTTTVTAACSEVGTRKTIRVTITDTSDGTTYGRDKAYTVVDRTDACTPGGGGDIPPKGDPQF